MASAQPEKAHWALTAVVPRQPRVEPEPEPLRQRAVSSVTGRPNRHARPRSATSPAPRALAKEHPDQQVQPGQPRPRWNSSTALPGSPLAPETLARSETSEEWNDDASERASHSSSQRTRSVRSERARSRRGSHTSSSQRSQSLSTRSTPSCFSARLMMTPIAAPLGEAGRNLLMARSRAERSNSKRS